MCLKNVLFFILAFITFSIQGQDKNTLEKKRKNLIKEIELTSQILNETKKSQKASTNELKMLAKQVSIRKELIENITEQLDELNITIRKNQEVVASMEKDLQRLKDEYAKMIYYAYKNQSVYSRLMFLFTAKNFNELYRRIKYLQRYTAYRKKQVELIAKTKKTLEDKAKELEFKRKEKEELLNAEKRQKQLLDIEKEKKDQLLTSLKQQESKLLKDIQKKKDDAAKLNKAIQDIIKKELELARKKAEEEAKKTAMKLTPEIEKLSKDFIKNQGKLPWPVERGLISGTFGEHPHPVIKNLKVKNDGIDIQSPKGTIVRSIFDGKVANVIYNPGFNYAVIIKHGEYFTVYSNLEKVFVKSGDELTAKQSIGVIYTEEDNGETKMNFQIWKGISKLDPAKWLYASSQ